MHTIFTGFLYLSNPVNPTKGNKKGLRYAKSLILSGDEWIRTTDSRIFSPMLYQLSYITAFVKSVAKVDI